MPMQTPAAPRRTIRKTGALATLLLSSAALSMSGCALRAATSGNVEVYNANRAAPAGDAVGTAVRFSERDYSLIRNYYRRAHGKPSPGVAKRERLPPGLMKRRPLPPGLQGRGLPATLEVQLTHLPPAYMRVVIGADVAIIERATRVVIDVIYDAAA